MKSVAKSVKNNINEMATRSDKSLVSGLTKSIVFYCKNNNIDPTSLEVKKALGNIIRNWDSERVFSQTYSLEFETVGYHDINYEFVKCTALNIESAIKKLAQLYKETRGEKRGDVALLYDENDECIAKYNFKYKSGMGFGAYISNNSYEEMSDINNWKLM